MDLREKAETLLASVAAVNLDAAPGTTTNLFTVPAGKACIITKVVTRNHSAVLTTAVNDYGWDAGVNDVINGVFAALTGATNYQRVVADDDAVRGAAANILKHSLETAEGGVLTCTIDVFGYLY